MSHAAFFTETQPRCFPDSQNCPDSHLLAVPDQGPVFVVQWLFDEAQLTVDNIQLTGQPVQEGQWRYIQNLGIELRNTLKDVP